MNNSYEIFRLIFIGGLALSVLMLITSVVMFFKMDIRRVLNEYNGTTKRKAIEKIKKRSSGEATTSADLKKSKDIPAVKKEKPKASDNVGITSKIKAQDRFDGFAAPETTSLSGTDGHQAPAKRDTHHISNLPVYEQRSDFTVIADITYVHSGEVIR